MAKITLQVPIDQYEKYRKKELEHILEQIKKLPRKEYHEFRALLTEHDNERWDAEMEEDFKNPELVKRLLDGDYEKTR